MSGATVSRLLKETQKALVDYIMSHHGSVMKRHGNIKQRRARVERLVAEGRFDNTDFQYFKDPERIEPSGSRVFVMFIGAALGAIFATLVYVSF